MRFSYKLPVLSFAAVAFTAPAAAQSPTTGSEIWPQATVQVQFPGSFRVVALGEVKQGESYVSQQWIFGTGVAYQWRRILGDHPRSVDPDDEHHLVLGAGYEYLDTTEPEPGKLENRLLLEATLRLRPVGPLLLSDRNRYEYRWVDSTYSTRYRNRLTLRDDLSPALWSLRPYAAAEAFYDVTTSAWNEEQYSLGIQWPYRRLLLLDAYYLRQNCTTCSPRDLNVLGISLAVYVAIAGPSSGAAK